MNDSEIAQLELFAQVDELLRRLCAWSSGESSWQPMNESRAIVRRLLGRLDTLRVRLEAPLVVATFGGTGTGKSSLVNALVGRECTASGRQRPTTTRPILIAHPEAELDILDLPLSDFDVQRVEATVLRDIVILDCPDPDTSEGEAPGSNLETLRRMLPHCDVLLYASTQQKYRSARVIDELDVTAAGCRLIFVQTHADHDSDIRQDWRQLLADRYDVPDLFFVDSVRAFNEQQSGQYPSGDFGRLLDLLTTRLAAVDRVRIRRANLLDLTMATLGRCRELVSEFEPAIVRVEETLKEQRARLTLEMSQTLRTQLESSRHLWEQRILGSVTSLWGVSPFSSLLRLYNGLGTVIASASLLRARTSAQLVLVGAMQGGRWLAARRKATEAEDSFEQAAALSLDDALLRESQLIIRGHLHDAQLSSSLVESGQSELWREAARVEAGFLDAARRRIDDVIERLAQRNSGLFSRLWYESLLLALVGYVLFRAGRNFFWDTWHNSDTAFLPIDFYFSAGVFFVLWCVILLMAFCRRLRRGLNTEIAKLADELAGQKLGSGLFPALEQQLDATRNDLRQLDQLFETCDTLRGDIVTANGLGSPRDLNAVSVG
ncbi:hypothetical protein GC176_26770 [bacterium]|nr:hypothetical protein [bacterium]